MKAEKYKMKTKISESLNKATSKVKMSFEQNQNKLNYVMAYHEHPNENNKTFKVEIFSKISK